MANNLKDHLKEVADAIRAKKGTSDLINPQDFATEIEGISGSGGGESGGSNWRYFDTTNATVAEGTIPLINMLFSIFKTKSAGYTFIECETPSLESWEAKIEVATATDFNLKIYHPEFTNGETKTIEELLNDLGGVEALEQALGFTEITEEQFYDLNA